VGSRRLLVFDCDGVLVDSEILVVGVEVELLGEAGFVLTPEEMVARYVGLSGSTMKDRLESDFDRTLPEGLFDRIQVEAVSRFAEQLRPVAGMAAMLAGLGDARCVASSSDPERIALSLKVTGLDSYFDGANVFSASMVNRGKPAPDLFLHAAASMGIEPGRCLVVEDSPHGVAAAVAAGMDVIGFTGGGHCAPDWADRLHDAGAAVVVGSAAELGERLA